MQRHTSFMRFMRAIAALLLSVAAIAIASTTIATAVAQSSKPSPLRGTVTDQTGAVVVGAAITITVESDATKQWQAQTDDRGRYGFEDLPPGRYRLTAKYEGFQEFSARVELKPQSEKTFDVRLKVGGIAVSTDVGSNDALGLSTDPRKNLSAVVLTAKDIASLPDDPQRMLLRLLEMAGSTGRPDDVAVLVDGFREYKRLPPKETIEMIRINSNPFSAEFSQPGLDRIEIVTKPGSDRYHGEIRFQGGDSALDSKNPLAPTKPETHTRNYNGYLLGPVIKERLDFLAYVGQWQQDESAVVHATVLDPTNTGTQPFASAVATPTRINSAQLGTNFKVFNQRINVSYTRNEERRRNLGLESGFDLPERAFNRTTTDEVGRLLWTTVGSHAVNDVRVQITRNRTDTNPLQTTPAIVVLDAFNAGGNQNAWSRASGLATQSSNTLTLQQGRHTVKAGVLFETTSQDSTDRSGFGGTFIFGSDMERDALGAPVLNEAGQPTLISPIENYRRTVSGIPGYAPSEFRIVRGNPEVGVDQWSAGWFALDDWALSNRFSLSYGVRQDVQNNVRQRTVLEPRASLSWLIDANGKNALKLGAGIFTGRVEPAVTLETQKVNGIDRLQFILPRPADYPALPPLDQATPVQSAIYTKADDIQVPHAVIATAAYERQFPHGLFLVTQYTYNRGRNLLRLRNITAPVPGQTTGLGAAPILQFESTGRSLQHQGMIGLRGHIRRELTLYGNYTYGEKNSDTDDPYTTPANSFDLSSEYGPAADDIRHQFVAGATIELRGGLMINPSLSIASGRPFNITTGRDNNGDTIFADRPAFAAAGGEGIDTRFGRLNPNPQPGDLIIPRNFGRERRQFTANLSVTESLPKGVILGLDVDNISNSRRLIRSNGVLTSPTFGEANQALNGRRLLASLRYAF